MKKHKKKKKIHCDGSIGMSLYELNQSLISQLPAYTNIQINKLEDRINGWEDNYVINQYFMLLCNDIHYYTILHRGAHENADFPDLGQSITGLLYESGYKIHSDEILDDHCEIWAKNEKGTYVFMLFPYDQGVVTYG